jgi:hypothetical protein
MAKLLSFNDFKCNKLTYEVYRNQYDNLQDLNIIKKYIIELHNLQEYKNIVNKVLKKKYLILSNPDDEDYPKNLNINIFFAYDYNRIPVNFLINYLKSLKMENLQLFIKLISIDLENAVKNDKKLDIKYLIIYQIINWYNSKQIIRYGECIPLEQILNLHKNKLKTAAFLKKVKMLSPTSKIYNIMVLCKNYKNNKVLNIDGPLCQLKILVTKTYNYMDLNFKDLNDLSNYLYSNIRIKSEFDPNQNRETPVPDLSINAIDNFKYLSKSFFRSIGIKYNSFLLSSLFIFMKFNRSNNFKNNQEIDEVLDYFLNNEEVFLIGFNFIIKCVVGNNLSIVSKMIMNILNDRYYHNIIFKDIKENEPILGGLYYSFIKKNINQILGAVYLENVINFTIKLLHADNTPDGNLDEDKNYIELKKELKYISGTTYCDNNLNIGDLVLNMNFNRERSCQEIIKNTSNFMIGIIEDIIITDDIIDLEMIDDEYENEDYNNDNIKNYDKYSDKYYDMLCDKDINLKTCVIIKQLFNGNREEKIKFSYNPKELYRLCSQPSNILLASIDGLMKLFHMNLVSVSDILPKIEELVNTYQLNNNIASKNNIYKKINWKIVMDILNIQNSIHIVDKISNIFKSYDIKKDLLNELYDKLETTMLYPPWMNYYGYLINPDIVNDSINIHPHFYKYFDNIHISDDIKNKIIDLFIDYLRNKGCNCITCQCCQVTTGFINIDWKILPFCGKHIFCSTCYNKLTKFQYSPGDKINISNHRCPICRIYIPPIRNPTFFDEIPFDKVIEKISDPNESNKPVYFVCSKENCGAVFCGGYESCLENLDTETIDKSKLLCIAHKISDNILKPCANPNCRLITDKINGCDHIICPGCNYHWCWHCGYCQLPFMGLNILVEYDHAPYCGPVMINNNLN